jgi:hypothetical protein
VSAIVKSQVTGLARDLIGGVGEASGWLNMAGDAVNGNIGKLAFAAGKKWASGCGLMSAAAGSVFASADLAIRVTTWAESGSLAGSMGLFGLATTYVSGAIEMSNNNEIAQRTTGHIVINSMSPDHRGDDMSKYGY